MAQTTQNEHSRLLALPRELRDIIYEYTFSDVEIKARFSLKLPSPASQNAGLILANRQIYTETRGLYFKLTKFYSIGDGPLFLMWLRKLPKHARENLTHVKILKVLPRAYEVDYMQDLDRAKTGAYRGTIESLRSGYARDFQSVVEVEVLKASEVEGHPHERELRQEYASQLADV